ncbi:transposase [Streptomyces viridochromogenes]|uniref:transposase n=1 Tax=Streptomyces viridochromogenes TaxID=1938 RepID=UPI001F341734|nr:transposase [Streptomyces viridochromogenes]
MRTTPHAPAPQRSGGGRTARSRVSVRAATDSASCPLGRQLRLPREWTDEPGRCRKAGVPQGTGHQEKWRLALGLLDVLAEWGLKAPVVVADGGTASAPRSASHWRNAAWLMCRH